MERSPFPYHGPLEAEQVSGREDMVIELSQRIADRRVTALLGPRRFGKTSLLKRVAADLEQVGPQPVWVDFYELNSMSDLVGALDRGLAAVTGSLRRIIDSVAGGVSVNLGVVGMELRRDKRHRPDPVDMLRRLLGILVESAQRQDVFVVFDEFAGIAGVEGAAGLLRTELQHHYQDLGLVFAGSQPSMMRTLFSDQTQPFFGQADLIEIPPLSDNALLEIVVDGFDRTDRDPGAVARRIVAMADGHPQRGMQLADAVWRNTAESAVADELAWADALEEVRASVDLGSERMYSLLSGGQKKTLRVIAGDGSIYGAAAAVLDLAPGTARAATETLEGNGFLARRDELVIVDPMLRDWIRRRFPI
ncbi:MAG: AAA family ATPase [Acidimicrobiales bacterium]